MAERRVPDEITVEEVTYLSVRAFAERSGRSVLAVRKAALRGQIPGFRDQRARVWLPASAVGSYTVKPGEIKLTPIHPKEG